MPALAQSVPESTAEASAADERGSPDDPRTSASEPPRAQETILLAHTWCVGLGLGARYTPRTRFGADRLSHITEGFHGSLAGYFFLAWAPLDWLEVSLLVPGIGVLLGTRHHDEVLLSAGVEGFGFGFDGLVVVLSTGVAYRHWFSPRTSLAATTRYTGLISSGLPDRSMLTGGFIVSHTVRDMVSFSFGVSVEGWPKDTLGVRLGSGRLGFRSVPLVQVHLSSSWTLNFDASVSIGTQYGLGVSQAYITGFTYTW